MDLSNRSLLRAMWPHLKSDRFRHCRCCQFHRLRSDGFGNVVATAGQGFCRLVEVEAANTPAFAEEVANRLGCVVVGGPADSGLRPVAQRLFVLGREHPAAHRAAHAVTFEAKAADGHEAVFKSDGESQTVGIDTGVAQFLEGKVEAAAQGASAQRPGADRCMGVSRLSRAFAQQPMDAIADEADSAPVKITGQHAFKFGTDDVQCLDNIPGALVNMSTHESCEAVDVGINRERLLAA